jgi:hypothetical protein
MGDLINLTPHDIKVKTQDGFVTIPKSGQIARVDVSRSATVLLNDIQIFKPTFGNVIGLPPVQDGKAYIVSAMVRGAVPDRIDVVSPGILIRDGDGNVVGCDGLDCN